MPLWCDSSLVAGLAMKPSRTSVNMTRRERVQRTLLADLGSMSKAERVVMWRTLDALEAELATGLESDETAERVLVIYEGVEKGPPTRAYQRHAMRAALRSLLEG